MMMETLYNHGYFLEPLESTLAHPKHVIGGQQRLHGAVSPNSGKPLLQLAAINTAVSELCPNPWRSDTLCFLYSWTCAICEGPFSYRQTDSYVEILEAQHGPTYSDFPFPFYPDTFVEVPCMLLPLTDEQRSTIAELNSAASDIRFDLQLSKPELSIPRHQIGGEPFFVSRRPVVSWCPTCNQRMRFLASIGNDTFRDSMGFSGNKFVQLIYEACTNCSVLTVNNYGD